MKQYQNAPVVRGFRLTDNWKSLANFELFSLGFPEGLCMVRRWGRTKMAITFVVDDDPE